MTGFGTLFCVSVISSGIDQFWDYSILLHGDPGAFDNSLPARDVFFNEFCGLLRCVANCDDALLGKLGLHVRLG